jgi:glycosyltransferase involved in cell wall biosynthesis
MRIAIVAEKPRNCEKAFASTLDHVTNHLAARGHSLLLLASEDLTRARRNVKRIELPSFTLPFVSEPKMVAPLAAGRELRRHLKSFQPHVVHLMNPFSVGLLALREARRLSAAVVASYHREIEGWPPPYQLCLADDVRWAYLRWIYNRADVSLCSSESTRFQLQLRGLRGMKVWRPGVNVELFHPHRRDEGWRRRLSGDSPDRPLLLYTGGSHPSNGLGVLRDMLDELEDVRLAVAGEGVGDDQVQRLFEDTGTALLGPLEGLDLARAYASADLLVTTAGDGGGSRSILEGMASGLPVVAAATGAGMELVSDCERGFLYWPDDAEDLAEAVRLFLSYRDCGRRLQSRARAYAESRSWSKAVGRLLAYYEDTLAHRPVPQRRAEREGWGPVSGLEEFLGGMGEAPRAEPVPLGAAIDDPSDR